MLRQIKKLIMPLVPQSIKNAKRNYNIGRQFVEWQVKGYGYPVPAHRLVKEATITHYREMSGYKTLIETGTCHGDMINAQKDNFEKITSIELDLKLFKAAELRFANLPHIDIRNGDSGEVLKEVLKELKQPAIFWLDAHYSGGLTAKGKKNTPIVEEIDSILEYPQYKHIILVDDARSFYRIKDYPTVEYLSSHIQKKDPRYSFKLSDDIIQYYIPS